MNRRTFFSEKLPAKPHNSQPTLLYVSPVIPSASGSGTSMRARANILALSRRFKLHVVVYPLYSGRRFSYPLSEIETYISGGVLVLPRDTTDANLIQSLKSILAQKIDVVHIFRLSTARCVSALLISQMPHAEFVLDMDDYESKRFARFASHYARSGQSELASRFAALSFDYSLLEGLLLPQFARTWISNPLDLDELRQAHPGAKISVVQNIYEPPSLKMHKQGAIHRLLFVGSMQYYPNDDAVRFFCASVLPKLRALVTKPLQLVIVGSRPRGAVRSLSHGDNIIVTGEVPDTAPYYEMTDLVIAPLRIGGGTRIKLLEAMWFQKPVVCTSLAAEGLVLNEGQLLIKDSPMDFAEACAMLLKNPDYANNIALGGAKWVREFHSLNALCQNIEEMQP